MGHGFHLDCPKSMCGADACVRPIAEGSLLFESPRPINPNNSYTTWYGSLLEYQVPKASVHGRRSHACPGLGSVELHDPIFNSRRNRPCRLSIGCSPPKNPPPSRHCYPKVAQDTSSHLLVRAPVNKRESESSGNLAHLNHLISGSIPAQAAISSGMQGFRTLSLISWQIGASSRTPG